MRALVLLFLALLPGCTPRLMAEVPFVAAKIANPCLIHALGFADAVTARRTLGARRWARVIIVTTARTAHALCAFEEAGAIWIYDPRVGSSRIGVWPALKTDATALVRAARKGQAGTFLEDVK